MCVFMRLMSMSVSLCLCLYVSLCVCLSVCICICVSQVASGRPPWAPAPPHLQEPGWAPSRPLSRDNNRSLNQSLMLWTGKNRTPPSAEDSPTPNAFLASHTVGVTHCWGHIVGVAQGLGLHTMESHTVGSQFGVTQALGSLYSWGDTGSGVPSSGSTLKSPIEPLSLRFW